MKIENWTMNTNKVQLWLESKDRGASGTAIAMTIELGNASKTDEERTTYWTAIRSIGKSHDDFPVAPRGTQSSMPMEAQLIADSVVEVVRNAFATISNAEMVLRVIFPSGHTGGAYADIDALADYYAKTAMKNMRAALKDNRWDGTADKDSGLPNMTAPPLNTKKKAKSTTTSEGEEEE